MGVQLDGGKGGKQGIAPNINVTPLVDVVLVLLIIFMVIIPNMQEGKTIEMIKVEQADKQASDAEPLVVTIDRNEIFTLGEADMARGAVLTELRNAYVQDPGQRVMLRGDSTLPYHVIRDFFAEVQEIGFERVALAVGVAREWSEEGA